LKYPSRRVQVNQDDLKLHCTYQLLVYAGDVNMLGVHTVKKNTEALVVTGKEIGLELNTDKTKYMVMPRDQNAGRSHNIKNDNSSFERVEEFRCLEVNLMNQNYIQEEIKSRLMMGNACYHSVHEKGGACNTHGGEVHTGFWWGA